MTVMPIIGITFGIYLKKKHIKHIVQSACFHMYDLVNQSRAHFIVAQATHLHDQLSLRGQICLTSLDFQEVLVEWLELN